MKHQYPLAAVLLLLLQGALSFQSRYLQRPNARVLSSTQRLASSSSYRGAAERTKRQERVGTVVQIELSQIVHRGSASQAEYLTDSLRRRISIVQADVSPDLRQARISVSISNSVARDDNAMDKRRAFSWLVRNAKPLKHALAQKMSHMKSCPELTFVQVDVSAAVDVMYLIDKISAGKDKRTGDLTQDDVDFDAELEDDDDWDDVEFEEDGDDDDEAKENANGDEEEGAGVSAKAIEADQTVLLEDIMDLEQLKVPSSYKGPHPWGAAAAPSNDEAVYFEPGQLPLDFVKEAMNHFKCQEMIPKRYVARILVACRNFFQQEPTLMRLTLPCKAADDDEEPHITVCGDTHGQFFDLMNIFSLNGFPSRSNPYLFNGDFVDRGSYSVEVILTLLMWKLHDPSCIYLTRGNHESKVMNSVCGFEREVNEKFDDEIYQLFCEVFQWLPLAAVIEDTVFVSHGGLPSKENVTLEDIAQVERGIEPPQDGASIMADLLWSDPNEDPGLHSSHRGLGFLFGPDITSAFLDRNSLKLLIRSHQMRKDGYSFEHNDKVITVFSAPNYCDYWRNKGAFVRLDASMEPKIIQFEAEP